MLPFLKDIYWTFRLFGCIWFYPVSFYYKFFGWLLQTMVDTNNALIRLRIIRLRGDKVSTSSIVQNNMELVERGFDLVDSSVRRHYRSLAVRRFW